MKPSSLQVLMEIEGYDDFGHFLHDYADEGIVPAICTICQEYTDFLEPDAFNVPCCDQCPDGGRVSSALVLGGLI